jgi:hypothetical protein
MRTIAYRDKEKLSVVFVRFRAPLQSVTFIVVDIICRQYLRSHRKQLGAIL